MLNKQKSAPVIDSRFLKVCAAKRAHLSNSVVLVQGDQKLLNGIIEQINKLEPTGVYFPIHSECDISFYDQNDFRNKDIIITLKLPKISKPEIEAIENEIRQAIPNARSITFVHGNLEIL
jgi:hypothetical protein